VIEAADEIPEPAEIPEFEAAQPTADRPRTEQPQAG
jgi:hypothetical protein